MSQSRVHWGILGVGSPDAQTIAQAIEASDTGKLVAVAGKESSAVSFAQTFVGIKTPAKDISVYLEFDDLLKDKDVHAVYISVPSNHHSEWITKAMRAGKHVLCDSPLSSTSQQMHHIINHNQATDNIFCMEAMSYHSHPFFKHLKKIIVADKKLGDIRFINATYTMDYSANSRYKGGSILDVGYYPLSYIRHLIGAEPTSVYGIGTRDPDTKKDSEATFVMQFENDIKVTLQTANNISMSWTFNITGTKGTLQVITNPWLPGNQGVYKLSIFDLEKANTSDVEEISYHYEKPPYILRSYSFDVLGKCILNKALTEDTVTLEHTLGNIQLVEAWRRLLMEKPQLYQSQASVTTLSHFKKPAFAEEKKAQADVQIKPRQQRRT
jgi:xylose dehydrogenase (NAD/NADP)